MEYLLIVPLERLQLYENLARRFLGHTRIQVLLDRRAGERRQRERIEKHALERRRAERRHQSRPQSDWFLLAPRKVSAYASSKNPMSRLAAADCALLLRASRFAMFLFVALGIFLFFFYSTTLLLSVIAQRSF